MVKLHKIRNELYWLLYIGLEVLTALVMHVATPHGAISQKMITLMVVT
jgi:hypothetical protein